MRVSIITVNYNEVEGLKRTIKSVIGQTFSDREFIVIDGASSDGSVDLLKQYANNISKLVSEPDHGIYEAMNKGIRLATGDYCIFMNSGDAFISDNVLEKVQKYLKTGKDIYNGNSLYIGKGLKIEWYRKGDKDCSPLHFFNSSICHQATFIKTSVLKQYMYDESLRMVSDWKFWVEAISLNHASYEAINLDVCCFSIGGLTTTHHELGIQERKKVLAELYSTEEIELFEKQSSKSNIFIYLRDGIIKNIWLFYANIFKIAQVRRIYLE